MAHFRVVLTFILIALGAALVSVPALASGALAAVEKAEQKVTDATGGAAVSQEDIKKLVETLESDTARADLVSNLKVLLNQQAEAEKKEEVIPALTESLGFRKWADQVMESYNSFLARNNLTNSLLGKLIVTVVATLLTLVLLWGLRRLVVKLLLKFHDKFDKFDFPIGHLRVYSRVFRTLITGFGLLVYFYSLTIIWRLPVASFFQNEKFIAALSVIVNVCIVVFIAAVIWESISLGLSHILKKADAGNQTRVKTLLPILKTILFGVFGAMFALVLLSELGINVAPLLAGAGIIGVAVGFGAQTMVKDYISGFTIILEDLIRVGDVVRVAGFAGAVEKITLRKLQVRDTAGTVYTIPYSEITTIQNLTKDFSFAVFNINISYQEDVDRVVEILEQVEKDLRADSAVKDLILDKLEIFGVDKFTDTSVVILARLKTLAGKQWPVMRAFNKQLKIAFDKAGIQTYSPPRTIALQQAVAKV